MRKGNSGHNFVVIGTEDKLLVTETKTFAEALTREKAWYTSSSSVIAPGKIKTKPNDVKKSSSKKVLKEPPINRCILHRCKIGGD